MFVLALICFDFWGSTNSTHCFFVPCFPIVGTVLSYKMPNFQTIALHQWSAYVVILREDFGWTSSTGLPVSTQEMIHVMKNVTELLIRGDTNVCGGNGENSDGMEVVYIQNITMRLPKGF